MLGAIKAQPIASISLTTIALLNATVVKVWQKQAIVKNTKSTSFRIIDFYKTNTEKYLFFHSQYTFLHIFENKETIDQNSIIGSIIPKVS